MWRQAFSVGDVVRDEGLRDFGQYQSTQGSSDESHGDWSGLIGFLFFIGLPFILWVIVECTS